MYATLENRPYFGLRFGSFFFFSFSIVPLISALYYNSSFFVYMDSKKGLPACHP
jgi:hypothetical protein